MPIKLTHLFKLSITTIIVGVLIYLWAMQQYPFCLAIIYFPQLAKNPLSQSLDVTITLFFFLYLKMIRLSFEDELFPDMALPEHPFEEPLHPYIPTVDVNTVNGAGYSHTLPALSLGCKYIKL